MDVHNIAGQILEPAVNFAKKKKGAKTGTKKLSVQCPYQILSENEKKEL